MDEQTTGAKSYADAAIKVFGQTIIGYAVGSYVVTEVVKYLPLTGGTMAGNLDMHSNHIINLAHPVDDHEAATKKYVNDQIISRFGFNDWELWFELKNPYINWVNKSFDYLSNMGSEPCVLYRSNNKSEFIIYYYYDIASLKTFYDKQESLYFLGPASIEFGKLSAGSTLFIKVRIFIDNLQWETFLQGLIIRSIETKKTHVGWIVITRDETTITAHSTNPILEIQIDDIFSLTYILLSQRVQLSKLLLTTKPVSNALSEYITSM